MAINIETIFGGSLIIIYAFERFNTPSNVRASTTAGRYISSVILYLLIYLFTFNIFTKYPGMVDGLKTLLESRGIDVTDLFKGLVDPEKSTIIFVALVFSLLVPKIPFISKIDEKIRKFLHLLASIPYEAIRRSKEMQDMELVIPDKHRNDVEEEMKSLGFSDNEINFDTEDALLRESLNIVYLIIRVRGWCKEHRFSVFMQDRANQLLRLNEHYKRYVSMMKSLYSLSEQNVKNPEIDALKEAEVNFRTNIYLDHRALYAGICDFISHAVLTCCLTNGNINKIMKDIGFIYDEDKKTTLSQTINHTIILFSMLLLFVLTNFILFRDFNENVEQTLVTITMIVSIYSAAVVCALFPKQMWSIFKYDDNHYPVSGYLLSGIMAIASSLTISLFFKTLIYAKE